jgi:hypothetical protein
MHVIAHQDVGVQVAAKSQECGAQALQITTTVIVIEKTRHAVVAALYDVLWNASDVNAWETGHGGSVDRPGRPRSPCISNVFFGR